jgi:hypothetical protein
MLISRNDNIYGAAEAPAKLLRFVCRSPTKALPLMDGSARRRAATHSHQRHRVHDVQSKPRGCHDGHNLLAHSLLSLP